MPAPYISREELRRAVVRLAAEIDSDHPDGVHLVAVLRGSVFFLADLIRAMQVPCSVDFIAISHYSSNTGRVRITKDLDIDIGGRGVVVVEDIVDTGLTMTYLLNQLATRDPARLEVCTLLDRHRSRIVPLFPRYSGFRVEDEFLVGYGLDFEQRYRNLPDIYEAHLPTLARDPDASVRAFYAPAEQDG